MNKLYLIFVLSACAVIGAGVSPVSAQTYDYNNQGIGSMAESGSATVSGSTLILAHGANSTGAAASVSYDGYVAVDFPFTASFDFVSSNYGGLTFSVLPDNFYYDTATTSGSTGAGLGIRGISPSVSFVIDRQPGATTTGLITNDTPSSAGISVGTAASSVATQTGYATVTYNGAGTLSMNVEFTGGGSPVYEQQSIAVNMYNLMGDAGYLGFTGATGSGGGVQEISNLSYSYDPFLPGPAPALGGTFPGMAAALVGFLGLRRRKKPSRSQAH